MIFGAFGEHYYVHPGLSARPVGRAQEPRGSPRPNRRIPTPERRILRAGRRLDAAGALGSAWPGRAGRGLVPLPDATFEIRAKTSRPPELQEKMCAHIANTVQLAVLIDPYILPRREHREQAKVRHAL